MELLLLRNRFYPTHTVGQLYVDGVLFCFVLEDVVREVEGQAVEKWKVQNETAIPQGQYRITLEFSKRFGPDTITVNDVKGFLGVRVHSGNTAADTDGCLIVGYKLDSNGLIAFGSTRTALADLKEKIRTGGKVNLTIKTVR